MPKNKELSIIIPIYNEQLTIETVLNNIGLLDFPTGNLEVIMVDDGSTDRSFVLANNFRKNTAIETKIIRHKKNHGKGAAIRSALKEAKGDLILIQDADLEYDTKDIPRLIKKLRYDIDVVYGTRNKNPKRKGNPFFVWGDLFLTWLVNLLYGSNLTDLYTGYKLFRSRVFQKIEIESNGFEFEMEVTKKILENKFKIVEIPISYEPRKTKDGKKLNFIDGIIGLAQLFK